NAFIVPSESSETSRTHAIGRQINDLRTVAKVVPLVRCEKATTGDRGFGAVTPIELRRMTAGFMYLECELRASQNKRRLFRRTHVGECQLNGLFGDTLRVAYKVGACNILPTGTSLISKRVGMRSDLNVVVIDRRRRN